MRIASIETAKEYIQKGWAEKSKEKWRVADIDNHRPADKRESKLLDRALCLERKRE